jgi:hypothetical protein
VIGDEPWFFLNRLPHRMWTLSRGRMITNPILNVQSKANIVMTIWNASGLYVIDRLSNDVKMNSDFLVSCNSVGASTNVNWLQIVPFALDVASVERRFLQKRKENAKAMLPFLYAAERDDWHHLMTDDKSWFFFNVSSHRMWSLSRDDVVTKSRPDIQSKELMFTIILNPSSFYVVNRLPNHIKKKQRLFRDKYAYSTYSA